MTTFDNDAMQYDGFRQKHGPDLASPVVNAACLVKVEMMVRLFVTMGYAWIGVSAWSIAASSSHVVKSVDMHIMFN